MKAETAPPNGLVRFALLGGGPGSFIGPVHRMAAELDRKAVLVAIAPSRDPDLCRIAGDAWGLPADRVYADWKSLIAAEAARPDGAEMVAIVTPNHTHFEMACAALRAGMHVMCDKPITVSLAEARELRDLIRRTARRFGVTYAYAAYPMVGEAREIIRRGDLGTIRRVSVEYSQGWLSTAIEERGDKQAAWRTDPALAGAGGCTGDIGVHAFHLAEFVTGLRVKKLIADLTSSVDGRRLDDDCNMLLRFENGAPGILSASQIAAGERNRLQIRVYGERGGIEWSHERADCLTLSWPNAPTQILHAGSAYLSDAANAVSRLPAGHPEGYIEAFANLYRAFADGIRQQAHTAFVPTIDDGVRGLAFVEAALASARQGTCWIDLEELAR